MNKENIGYVYILTNPSFREDWVKIGKRRVPGQWMSDRRNLIIRLYLCLSKSLQP